MRQKLHRGVSRQGNCLEDYIYITDQTLEKSPSKWMNCLRHFMSNFLFDLLITQSRWQDARSIIVGIAEIANNDATFAVKVKVKVKRNVKDVCCRRICDGCYSGRQCAVLSWLWRLRASERTTSHRRQPGYQPLMPNTHRRRYATVELRRVGVGGVNTIRN